MPTNVYELEIEPNRIVAFREMTVDEFESCVKQAGQNHTAWDLTQIGLRRSLVRDGGEELEYPKLIGSKLGERFTTRQLLSLRIAWEEVHTPSAEDLARVKAMRVTAG